MRRHKLANWRRLRAPDAICKEDQWLCADIKSRNSFINSSTSASDLCVPTMSQLREETAPSQSKNHAPQLSQLRELFPDWSSDDLASLLQETHGSVELAVERISQGMSCDQISQRTPLISVRRYCPTMGFSQAQEQETSARRTRFAPSASWKRPTRAWSGARRASGRTVAAPIECWIAC